MELKIFMGNRLKDGASIGMKHRLYVPHWLLMDLLKSIRGGHVTSCNLIIIAYCNDIPIGLCASVDGRIMIFVRKSMRRKGIGTSLYEQAMKTLRRKKHFIYYSGIKGHLDFYKAIQI